MAAHTCHAQGCETPVPRRMLMCGRHWRLVPAGLQAAVWAAYRPGQERLDGTNAPTAAYLAAAHTAIDAVAAAESRQ